MSDCIVIGGCTERRKIPVRITGETPEGFRIEALERVALPGRGFLEKGESAFISWSAIKLDQAARPRKPWGFSTLDR